MPIEIQTNLELEAQPTQPSHVVNIEWVVNYVTGKIKAPVRAVATSNQAGTYAAAPAMTFTYTAMDAITVDGVTLAANDRVLFVGQTAAQQNGIYTVTTVGTPTTHTILTRASDFNASDKIFSGVTIGVNAGDDHAHSFWKLTSDDPITLDTTTLNFIPIRTPEGVGKYTETITGDGTADEFTVTHNLGSEDVHVQIWNNATNGMVLADVTIEDGDEITIGFDQPPTAAQVYRIVVMG